MAVTSLDSIRIQVAEDRLRAEMVVPHQVSLDGVTVQSLRPLVEAAQVVWNDDVQRHITELLATQRTPGKTLVGVIARGTPSRHGADGRLEWTIDAERQEQARQADNHYDRSAFIAVEPGAVLGRLIEPEPGTPGYDVTGQAIPSKPGKPHPLLLDESITQNSDGTLVAAAAGLLVRRDSAASIQPVLHVTSGVDFSTGNIDFDGSVVIHEGIKDRFKVNASQNVQIMSLVEAATITCGGNLEIAGGFAGRGQGGATVGGGMIARYLDDVNIEVRGDLEVKREIINCDLLVHGNLRAPEGSIIGGCAVVAGAIVAANLGSAANARTHVVLGTIPRLDPLHLQLSQVNEGYRSRVRAIQQQIASFNALPEGDRLSDDCQHRIAELHKALEHVSAQQAKASQSLATFEQRLKELRLVDLQVSRRLNEGVVLEYNDCQHLIRRTIDGPVHICLDPAGVLIYVGKTCGGPVAEIAEPLVPRPQVA